jgi:hypothetical protein
MIRRITLLHLGPDTSAADRSVFEAEVGDAEARVPGVSHAHLGRHPEGTVGGGDYTWDLAFPGGAECPTWRDQQAAAGYAELFEGMVTRVDSVQFESSNVHVVDPDMRDLLKRTLFLEVAKGTAADAAGRFDRILTGMPRYIPAIRNWAYHRVDDAGSVGPRRWTHVWEQEFADLSGLRVDYMMSPYHWGYVDGWFDAESPQRVVEPDVGHVFCPSERSILAWT